MIIDYTGIPLIPGKLGADCPGNGTHINEDGTLLECCCDECDYMLCCMESHQSEMCLNCRDQNCPHCPS